MKDQVRKPSHGGLKVAILKILNENEIPGNDPLVFS